MGWGYASLCCNGIAAPKDRGRNAQKKEIGTSTASLLFLLNLYLVISIRVRPSIRVKVMHKVRVSPGIGIKLRVRSWIGLLR